MGRGFRLLRRIQNSVTRGHPLASRNRGTLIKPAHPGPKQPSCPRVGFALAVAYHGTPAHPANGLKQALLAQKTWLTILGTLTIILLVG